MDNRSTVVARAIMQKLHEGDNYLLVEDGEVFKLSIEGEYGLINSTNLSSQVNIPVLLRMIEDGSVSAHLNSRLEDPSKLYNVAVDELSEDLSLITVSSPNKTVVLLKDERGNFGIESQPYNNKHRTSFHWDRNSNTVQVRTTSMGILQDNSDIEDFQAEITESKGLANYINAVVLPKKVDL